MGSSTSTTTHTVTQTAEPTYGNIPNFSALAGAAAHQIDEAAPYSYAGAGYQLLPTAQLGQVQLPGVNNTNIGGTSNATSQNNASTNVAASNTGNTSLNSVANSLGSLLGNTGVGSGFAQGLQGTSSAGFGNAMNLLNGMSSNNSGASSASSAPYSNTGGTSSTGGKLGGTTGNSGTSSSSTQQQPPPPPPTTSSTGTTGTTSTGTTGTTGTTSSSLYPDTTSSSSYLHSGSTIPNSPTGDTVKATQPHLDSSYDSSFLGSNLTSPFYNQAAVAGNLGTTSGAATNSAGTFMNSLFSNGLSQMSQDYLQAGAANAGQNLQQGISQLQSQYENDPFNNALGRSEANLISQTANNTLQTASGMGVQQQQIAANQMSTPFNLTEQAASVGVQDAQGLFNMANTAYTEPYQLATSVLSQTPISSPAVGSTTTNSSKL